MTTPRTACASWPTACNPGPIGIDKLWPSHFTIRLMEARGDIRPVVGSRCVDDARMHKDAQELQWMRESSHKNDHATMQTIARLHTGMSENEAAALHTALPISLAPPSPALSRWSALAPTAPSRTTIPARISSRTAIRSSWMWA